MIYVTGDIHGEVDISKLNTQNFSQAKEGDYLIICGDFGLIWDIKPSKNEEYWLKWLSKKPWTTLLEKEFLGGKMNYHQKKNVNVQWLI